MSGNRETSMDTAQPLVQHVLVFLENVEIIISVEQWDRR